MTAISSTDPAARRRRPAFIWVIAVIVLCATAFTLFSIAMIPSMLEDSPDLTDAQRQFLQSQGLVNYALAIATILGNITGCVLLILLRRAALYAFLVAAALALINTTYNIIANDWFAAVGTAGLIRPLLGWAVNIAILVYVWSLFRKGVLR